MSAAVGHDAEEAGPAAAAAAPVAAAADAAGAHLPPKGAGKGGGPAPPPPPKGAGKGGGLAPPPPVPAKGAGKGLPPAGKGKGKGKSSPAPPLELLAPAGTAHLRAHKPLLSASGTLWEGLDPWGTAGADVLEGTLINMERLRHLWSPMPEPPMPEHRRRHRDVLPSQLLNPVAIAVRAKQLEAELVRRSLTEDMQLLSQEQVHVLCTFVLPAVAEAEPHLRLAAQERGVENFGRAEAVLWTLANIPMVELRARLIYVQSHMGEDVQQVKKWAEAATGIVSVLEQSRPVRTVLQTLLAVRNILAQRGCPGYAVASFDGLPHERMPRQRATQVDPLTGQPMPLDMQWLREHNPSVLSLVAEMLESTHESRCRLRFLRMMAVGRCVSGQGPCRIIWSFLDDLQESPRDALTVLTQCAPGLCDRDLIEEIESKAAYFRHMAVHELPALLRHPSVRVDGSYARQLDALAVRLADALVAHDDGCRALFDAADDLCRLGQVARPSMNRNLVFDSAASVLRSLRLFGTRLSEEMTDVYARRRELARTDVVVAGRSATRRRHWAPVDTSGHTVVVTSDPDIIRKLRWRPALEGGETGAEQEAQAKQEAGKEVSSEEARAKEEREASFRRFSNLIHGGAEGVYQRDPVTGSWGRRLDGVDGTGGEAFQLGGPHTGP